MDENGTADAEPRILDVEAPYFEELKVGQFFPDAPDVTLTAGHAAFHEALFGDRRRLPLDATLCEEVTGSARDRAAGAPGHALAPGRVVEFRGRGQKTR